MFEYCLDINEKSYMRVYTPDNTALSFPFWIYEDGYFEANGNYYTKRSDKPMYLLIYTLSGCGMLRVGGRTRSLSAGTAALINCRDLHEYRTLSTTPWCFHWVHFDGASMDAYKRVLLDEFEVWQIGDKNRFIRYIDQIHDIARQSNGMLHYIQTSDLISGLLLILCNSHYSAPIKGEVDSDTIRTVCGFIEGNLETNISVEQLASLVHLSKFYFIRLFQRFMGVSPYQYVQMMRINRAKELLMTTELSINEIAISVGFSGSTRFSKCFSDMTGMSPTQYRKNSYILSKD